MTDAKQHLLSNATVKGRRVAVAEAFDLLVGAISAHSVRPLSSVPVDRNNALMFMLDLPAYGENAYIMLDIFSRIRERRNALMSGGELRTSEARSLVEDTFALIDMLEAREVVL